MNGLTTAQRERLQSLQSEILFDRIVVSFSIDARDEYGRKKSTFYSASATRKPGAETPGEGHGFSVEDERIVHAILAKRVVATVYGDAVTRKVLPGDVARAEVTEIIAAYDRYLAGLLKKAKP